MNCQVKHLGKRVRNVAVFAVMIAAGTSCSTEPVTPIEPFALTTLVQVDPASRTDTTYVGDVFDIPMPRFRDASGKARGGFNVSRTTNAAAIARPTEALTAVVANSIDGETDSAPQFITVEPLSGGDARLSITSVLTDPKTVSGLTSGVTTPTGAPLVFTHNVIVLPNKPTILGLPSVIRMQVGDTMTLAPMPRGSSGGTVTTGTTLWSVESGVAVATLHPLILGGGLQVWPNTVAYSQDAMPARTLGGTGRIGMKGRSPGEAELVVVWFSAGGARLQKNITVIVTARGTPTIFTSGGTVDDPADERESVSLGKTRAFTLRDGDNVLIPQSLVEWVSSLPGVADITPSGATGGVATCRSVGTATILANVPSTGAIATAKLLCAVSTSPVSVSITPISSTVKVGSDVTFDATAVDPLLFSTIKWRVTGENAVVVSVASSSALTSRVTVRGLRAGIAPVVAEYGEVNLPSASATASLAVTPRTLRLVPATNPTPVAAGGTQQYTIEEVDAANTRIGTIPTTQFVWSSNAPGVAEVDSNGKATCATTGPGGATTITANRFDTNESLTATLSCSAVQSPTSPTVLVSPGAVSVSQGRSTTVGGVVSNGLNVTDITWTTRDASVASISPNGSRSIIVNGLKAGSSTYVVGTYSFFGGESRDSVLVTVTGASTAQVDHITLDPDSANVANGQQVQYRIRYWNASNAEMNGEVGNTTTFTVDVSSVAQISAATGLVTTRGVGSTFVNATYRMPYYDSLVPVKASLTGKAKLVVR